MRVTKSSHFKPSEREIKRVYSKNKVDPKSISKYTLADVANFVVEGEDIEYVDLGNKENSKVRRDFNNKKSMMQHINYDNFQGTPLEKACQVSALIDMMMNDASRSKGTMQGEKIAGMINKAMERQNEKKTEQKQGSGANVRGGGDGEGKDTQSLSGFDLAKMEPLDIKAIDKLAKIGSLTKMIGAHRSVKVIKDKTSRKKRRAKMTSYGDITKASLSSMAMPDFEEKFISKRLMVNERVSSVSKKQILVFLIDDSGSMNAMTKKSWVKALLMNRVDAVLKGQAVLYINKFVSTYRTSFWMKVSNAAEVEDVLKNFRSYFTFGGGSTNIEGSLRKCIDEIKTGKLGKHNLEGERPQICVMNDGQDEIDTKYKPEIITHGFILGSNCNDMKKMCENSGGIYRSYTK